MTVVERAVNQMLQWCEEFGGKIDKDFIKRSNIEERAFLADGAYFGCIRPEEDVKGSYHDFSFVVFPDKEGGASVISLCVGTQGFRNDYELATQPGLRRRFLKLITEQGYMKTDFADIQTKLDEAFISKVPNLARTLRDPYGQLISACEIIPDLSSEASLMKMKAMLALYADIRKWPTNQSHRKAVQTAIDAGVKKEEIISDESLVYQLLLERKYVVLQGAPGTGKTWMVKHMAQALSAKTFFIQFHAETSYADFIWGIRPKLTGTELGYQAVKGPFIEALEYAIQHPQQKVLLIIDEINRANLSNVLGQVFYLFEYQMQESDVTVKLSDSLTVSKLPDNFYAIATMNTADRSLAVVDFALRRRFAWYTMKPKEILLMGENQFFREDFNRILAIFEQHAQDEELSLIPGQGYFIAKNEEQMNNRLRYELMPLIKEYLLEGLLATAKDSFSNYFYERIGELMFQ